MVQKLFLIQVNSHENSRKNRLFQMYLYFESKCASNTPFALDCDQVPFAHYSCQ